MNLSTSTERIAAINRASCDAVYKMVNSSLDVSRKLFELQINAANRLIEQNLSNAKSFLSYGLNGNDIRRASDWQNLMAHNVQSFIELTRSFYEVTAEAQSSANRDFKDNIEPAINEAVNQTREFAKESVNTAQQTANAVNSQAQKATENNGRSRKSS